MKDLRKRYGKALRFCGRLLEIQRSKVKNVEVKRLLKKIKKLA